MITATGSEVHLLATLDRLAYIGRSLTPASSPIRFAARIFAADAEHCIGTLRSTPELEDVRYVGVAEALTRLPMIDSTQFFLCELQRVLESGPLNAIPHTPVMYYRDNVPVVQYE